jgi:hypothetical protein
MEALEAIVKALPNPPRGKWKAVQIPVSTTIRDTIDRFIDEGIAGFDPNMSQQPEPQVN